MHTVKTEKTTCESKTWERTKTPGASEAPDRALLRALHPRGQDPVCRLKTNLVKTAGIRFAEENAKVEPHKAARTTSGSVASMQDLATLMRNRIAARTVSEHTKDLNRQVVAFLEKTWDGFASSTPPMLLGAERAQHDS